MKRIVVSRRQVLRGAGGFSLALPFLPSLVPVRAYAATAVIARQPRLVAFASSHGGVREGSMYPTETWLDKSKELYPGHVIRWGQLQPSVVGSNTVLSTIATAPSNQLTPALVAKLNIIRGLDVPWFIAHNTGGHLGNYARNDGNSDHGKAVQSKPTPTIDQLLGFSDKFYPSMQGIRERVMVTGFIPGALSYNFANPATRSGGIQEIKATQSVKALFERIFDPTLSSDKPSAPVRPPIIDRVIANYKSLRESNRRLSAADRERLDAHIQRLSELEARVGARVVSRSAACKDVKLINNEPTGRDRYVAINDVITAAFICGTSRIAVVGLRENEFAKDSGGWHHGVAHQWESPGPQARLVEAHQNLFAQQFVDLMVKLDIEEQPGQTILDNSFLMWTNECGEGTHDSRSRPTFTAGGGAGAFQTGLYIDYRNMSPKGNMKAYGQYRGQTGLTHNQFLATILQAYGMPPSDWQNIPNNGKAGYGNDYLSSEFGNTYAPQVMDKASDPLPILTRS